MTPENIRYYRVIVPANKASDGETSTSVMVSEEVNGYAVWFQSAEHGVELLQFFPRQAKPDCRELAMEHATNLYKAHVEGQKIRGARAHHIRNGDKR